MKHLAVALAALAAVGCKVDSGSAPTTNLVSAGEKAAVQQALALSFGTDSLFATFSTLVLPFIDQATPQANASGDTTKIAAFQLEVTASGVTAGISGVLAWRGYRPATGTVDSVFLVVGGGSTPPVSDSLYFTNAFDTQGDGTAWLVAQATNSSVQTWRARMGALHVQSATYGKGDSFVQGGLKWTRSRGMLQGDLHVTGALVLDSSTTTSASLSFSSGVNGVLLQFTTP